MNASAVLREPLLDFRLTHITRLARGLTIRVSRGGTRLVRVNGNTNETVVHLDASLLEGCDVGLLPRAHAAEALTRVCRAVHGLRTDQPPGTDLLAQLFPAMLTGPRPAPVPPSGGSTPWQLRIVRRAPGCRAHATRSLRIDLFGGRQVAPHVRALAQSDEWAPLSADESGEVPWIHTEGHRARIDPADRQAIYTRDGGRCQRCGTSSDLTLDHVRPLSRGGTNDRANLTTLCGPCNNLKGAALSGA